MARHAEDFRRAEEAIQDLIKGTSTGIEELLLSWKMIGDPSMMYLQAADFSTTQLNKLESIERQFVAPHSLRIRSDQLEPMKRRLADAREVIKSTLMTAPGAALV
jgi:hypothetical protein